MKGLLYYSGELFDLNQTGGKKRFVELAKYFTMNYNFDLCCADSTSTLNKNNLSKKYNINNKKLLKFFPPEFSILIKNYKLIKNIRSVNYDNIITFDVPPTIGLCLLNVKNIVLMIRKDMIGYEMVKTAKKSIRYYFKLLYQWLSEDICIKKAKMIICQCEYDKNTMLFRHKRLIKKHQSKFRIQINNVNPSWIVEKSTIDKINFKINNKLFNICFVGNGDN